MIFGQTKAITLNLLHFSFLPLKFIAEHGAICYGMSLWSFWVNCPSQLSSQLIVHHSLFPSWQEICWSPKGFGQKLDAGPDLVKTGDLQHPLVDLFRGDENFYLTPDLVIGVTMNICVKPINRVPSDLCISRSNSKCCLLSHFKSSLQYFRGTNENMSSDLQE